MKLPPKKMAKVVYNNRIGSFSLSEKALERMFELGSKYVTENSEYNAPHTAYGEVGAKKWWEKKYVFDWDCPRHDPILVQVVSELGYLANGPEASLNMVDVLSKYIIMESKGWEQVIQPQDIQWVEVSNRL